MDYISRMPIVISDNHLAVTFISSGQSDERWPLESEGGDFDHLEVHLLVSDEPLPSNPRAKYEWEKSADHYGPASLSSQPGMVRFAISDKWVGRDAYVLVSVVVPHTETTDPSQLARIEQVGDNRIQTGFRPLYQAVVCSQVMLVVSHSMFSLSSSTAKLALLVAGLACLVLALIGPRRWLG